MDKYTLQEQAYKNGYEQGKQDAVKHGRWISLEPEIGLFECSECEHKILRAKCNYCPGCGSKMDADSGDKKD